MSTPTDANKRRAIVSEKVAAGQTPSEIAAWLEVTGVVNEITGRPFSPKTIARDIAQAQMKYIPNLAVSETIGTSVPMTNPLDERSMRPRSSVMSAPMNSLYTSIPPFPNSIWRGQTTLSYDSTRADYRFWDRLRRGKADGYAFAGLFCTPTCRGLASFVWGSGPTLSIYRDPEDETVDDEKVKHTNRFLDRWRITTNGLLSQALEDDYALGDQYFIQNSDGSLSVPSPAMVSVEYDPFDYRKVVAYEMRTVLDKATIIDRYTDSLRSVIISTGGRKEVFNYPILIGRLPVIHWPNDRGSNELSGRPIYAATPHLFERMDTLIEKLLDGVELHGNPIPVLQGLKDLQQALTANSAPQDESFIDDNGDTVSQSVIDWNRHGALLLGEGASVDMLSPANGFTDDILATLKYLFFLFTVHVDIPEFIYGGMDDSGNRNLTEQQFKIFTQKIKLRRLAVEGRLNTETDQPSNGLIELARVRLLTERLTDPQISTDAVRVNWPKMSLEEAQITLQKTIYADSRSWMRPNTGLATLELVDNPDEEFELATEYYAAHPRVPLDSFQTQLNTAAHQDTQPSSGGTDNPQPTENPGGGVPATRTNGKRKEPVPAN